MKKLLTLFAASLMAGIIWVGCESEEPNECYTCNNCTGQYAHLINGNEYCVSGFDNRSDWESNRTALQTDSGCTCE